MVLSRNVETVKAVEWSPKWSNLAPACILNLKDLVTHAEEREKSSMKKTNARPAMVRKLSKKRRF